MKRFTVICVIIVIGIVVGSAANYFYYKIHAQTIHCGIFKSQSDAQAHYRPSLDRNHNGKACEAYHYGK